MMESGKLLSEADPVADWRVDPESAEAKAMLAGILATARDGHVEQSGLVLRRPRGTALRVRRRRIAFGGAAAVVLTVVMSTLWSGGPVGTDAAYAVTAKPDGSVELTLRWDQLENVSQLAARLRQAGVPTEVRSSMPARFCNASADRDRTADALNDALNKRASDGEPVSSDGYLMRPKLFPEGSILVIAAFFDPATQVRYKWLYLAPVGSTDCALNYPLGSALYTGSDPHPPNITWPNPAEPE
jgi:hypothetical protein